MPTKKSTPAAKKAVPSYLIKSAPPPIERPRSAAARTPLIQWLHDIAEHPGEWFKYPETVSVGTTTRILHRQIQSMPDGAFEATSRSDGSSDSSRVYLWARYIG